jgi:catechol 2,3-dioxygenase-like lactoylglutathione lyase family enzyme
MIEPMASEATPPEGVLETCLYHDPGEREEIERFYGETLGLRRVGEWPTGIAFRVGAGVLLLFDRVGVAASTSPMSAHGTVGPGHACLRVDAGAYEDWRARIEAEGIGVAHEETWRDGLRSFYFSDPAGNLLEIAEGDIWPD